MSYSSTIEYKANFEGLIGAEVTGGGARILTGVKLGLFLTSADVVKDSPAWKDPVTIGNRWGYPADGTLSPGIYEVWAKVVTTGEPFVPVHCGNVTLT